jgi:catechol 2,3-dioxygenase-like lactoylglutathione lyase family enzyme
MADLENLRKQAKQIVRWHRQRHFPVAHLIREYLPRFASMDDATILEGSFQLADAQELVARRAGLQSWSELLQTSRADQSPNALGDAPELTAVEPQLYVRDLAGSIAYYGRMGFELAFTYGEPPFYCQVRRDRVALNLRLVPEPVADASRVSREDLLSASVIASNVKQLFLEFRGASVEFHQPLRKEPWGARTFIVRDPDGNLILFAG